MTNSQKAAAHPIDGRSPSATRRSIVVATRNAPAVMAISGMSGRA
ncbi:MAG: hypothetical protein AAGI46_01405 [Planctomycetota bacterium]